MKGKLLWSLQHQLIAAIFKIFLKILKQLIQLFKKYRHHSMLLRLYNNPQSSAKNYPRVLIKNSDFHASCLHLNQ